MSSLKSSVLKIANGLPKGDPTRRKLIQAMVMTDPDRMAESVVAKVMRDSTRLIEKIPIEIRSQAKGFFDMLDKADDASKYTNTILEPHTIQSKVSHLWDIVMDEGWDTFKSLGFDIRDRTWQKALEDAMDRYVVEKRLVGRSAR